MPPALSGWVPGGHLSRFVSEVAHDRDSGAIEDASDEERGGSV